MIPFLVFIACMCGVFAAYLVATRGSDVKRKRLQQRLADALLYSQHSEDADVQLARQELMSEIPALSRLLMRVRVATSLRRMLDQADLHITVSRLVMLAALAGLLAAVAVSMLTISKLLMVTAGVVAASAPFLHVAYKRKKRLNKFLEHLPESLELMSRALQAGHAFAESLHMVSTEMPEPVATEFRKTYEEQNLGLSLKLALENLAERVPLLDLRFCITAIMIQRETGGNLAEILEKVAHTIRERFRILEDLNTLTTSSRMSAWILCGLPVFVAVAVTVMNPDYMSVLWRDPRGHNLLFAAGFMQVMGMLIIRKMLNIKI
jgi:tight adherence protein B